MKAYIVLCCANPIKTQLQKHPTFKYTCEGSPKQKSLHIHTPLQTCELWKGLWWITLVTRSGHTIMGPEDAQESCV